MHLTCTIKIAEILSLVITEKMDNSTDCKFQQDGFERRLQKFIHKIEDCKKTIISEYSD